MKKLLAILITAVLVLGLSAGAFASGEMSDGADEAAAEVVDPEIADLEDAGPEAALMPADGDGQAEGDIPPSFDGAAAEPEEVFTALGMAAAITGEYFSAGDSPSNDLENSIQSRAVNSYKSRN